jgi:hypothetical protein
MMLFILGFDSHEPHATMCLSCDAVRAGSLLRRIQRIEAINVPINWLREGPNQRPVRQNRAALLAAPLRRIFGALDARIVLLSLL